MQIIEKITNLILVLLPNMKGTKLIVVGLISALIITIVSISFEKYVDYRLNRVTNEISEQVDIQIKDVVTETIDSEGEKYAERINKALKKYPEIDMQIDELLSQLNKKLKANQSVLFIFHDGTRTPDGFPFIKYSATNEVIDEQRFNISPRLTTYQSVPYSKAAYYAQKMAGGNVYYLNDIKEIEQYDIAHYYSFKEENIKSIAFIPVESPHRSKIVGFIVVYGYDNYINFINQIDYMKTISTLIEKHLELKYKK